MAVAAVVAAAIVVTNTLDSIDVAPAARTGPGATLRRTVITLTFHPERSESAVLVRGTYFRIHGDGTLRGPDNAVAATYADGLWQLGPRRYHAFECAGPVYLRVTSKDGRREYIGPYDFVKVVEGAVLTHDSWLGAHAARGGVSLPAELWQEIAFLTSAETGRT